MDIEEKRRELFVVWAETNGWDKYHTMYWELWLAWNAALDSVVIELPENKITFQTEERFNIRQSTISQCRAAIEAQGLGIKIK